MKRLRRCRWLALVALLGLFFQQLAMASYVCPLQQAEAMAAPQPACHDSDEGDDPARCHQHCHPADATADAPTHFSVPPAAGSEALRLRLAATRPAPVDEAYRLHPPPIKITDFTIGYCIYLI
ncbi:hypothetical protein [Tahibacter amnicola]|uniref:Secreted protein n=1 Tax=Tahibacter amnicola TaxID=2976241 RepID=A0ABY6BAY9_9GAMM|nr:hypothetical protein [Tahibacter amnicola]UXI66313.1 hypothetical protein N4264_16320 [Tahibacter amnicola]